MARNRTKVQQNESNGQYTTTIPRQLAEAMNLQGETLEWTVAAGNKLEVKKVDE